MSDIMPDILDSKCPVCGMQKTVVVKYNCSTPDISDTQTECFRHVLQNDDVKVVDCYCSQCGIRFIYPWD
jgi:hypothetical protein